MNGREGGEGEWIPISWVSFFCFCFLLRFFGCLSYFLLGVHEDTYVFDRGVAGCRGDDTRDVYSVRRWRMGDRGVEDFLRKLSHEKNVVGGDGVRAACGPKETGGFSRRRKDNAYDKWRAKERWSRDKIWVWVLAVVNIGLFGLTLFVALKR
jgi:hypothetical protein